MFITFDNVYSPSNVYLLHSRDLDLDVHQKKSWLVLSCDDTVLAGIGVDSSVHRVDKELILVF